MENLISIDYITEELDGLKGELEIYKPSAEEMENYLEYVQRIEKEEC